MHVLDVVTGYYVLLVILTAVEKNNPNNCDNENFDNIFTIYTNIK